MNGADRCQCDAGVTLTVQQVYADSSVLATAFAQCAGCSRARRQYLVHTLITAMGNTDKNTSIIFALPEPFSTDMGLVLEMFPFTPWLFIFRHPYEVLALHCKIKIRRWNLSLTSHPCMPIALLSPQALLTSVAAELACELLLRTVPAADAAPFIAAFGRNVFYDQLCGAYFNMEMSNALAAFRAPGSLVRQHTFTTALRCGSDVYARRDCCSTTGIYRNDSSTTSCRFTSANPSTARGKWRSTRSPARPWCVITSGNVVLSNAAVGAREPGPVAAGLGIPVQRHIIPRALTPR